MIRQMDANAPTKVCYLCRTERLLSSFTRRWMIATTLCVPHAYRGCCERERQPALGCTIPTSARACYLCRRFLANSQFTRRSNGTYFSGCKDCNRHVFGQRRRARLGELPAVESTVRRHRANYIGIHSLVDQRRLLYVRNVVPAVSGGKGQRRRLEAKHPDQLIMVAVPN
jgi:hypothetical protein